MMRLGRQQRAILEARQEGKVMLRRDETNIWKKTNSGVYASACLLFKSVAVSAIGQLLFV